VTPETVFFTASTTKSFTAASVSLLIDDAASNQSIEQIPPDLSWTSTISSVIPEDFALENDYATSHVTFEDALSNRSGLPDHLKSFKPKTTSLQDGVRSLRHLPLAADMRTQYLYSSYMFSAVSHAIEQMTGTGLGDFMRERIWTPLEMDHTYWTPQEAKAASSTGTNLAHGYAWNAQSESYTEEAIPDFPVVSGAGAIISNVLDYTKWLRCMMAQSAPMSPAAHATLIEPRIHYTQKATNPFPAPHAYALGWRVDNYRGQRVIWHTGSWIGYGSTMMYLPDLQWGLVMMGNTTLTSNFVQTALFMRLLDELLGTPVLERIDWSVKFMQLREQKREDVRNALVRLYPDLPCPIDPPLFPLGAYAGQYRHAGYGDMMFELCGDALVASRLLHEISMVIRMTHATGEFWMARLEIVNQDPRDHEIVRAEFQRTEDGIARRIGLDLEPALRGQMIWFDSITS
jgi:CubicO group peptidase (beta-lactamase class C family)